MVSNQAGGLDPWDLGAAWAILGHIADRHAAQLADAVGSSDLDVSSPERDIDGLCRTDPPPLPHAVDPVHAFDGPRDMGAFIGQEHARGQLRARVESARARGVSLDHTLLLAAQRGVGRSTLARLAAGAAGRRLVRLAPPFPATVVEQSATMLADGEILLLEDLDHANPADATTWRAIGRLIGASGTEPSSTGPPETISVLATAVDPDAIPSAVLDRFTPVRLEPYTSWELTLIAAQLCGRYLVDIDDETLRAIGANCRGSAYIARMMVLAARDLAMHLDRRPSTGELFSFLRLPAPHQ